MDAPYLALFTTPGISLLLVVLLCSSFVKVLTTLSIVKTGLGLDSASFGLVVFALSFVISLLVIEPQLSSSGISFNSAASFERESLEKNVSPFLKKHADAAVLTKLQKVLPQKVTSTPEIAKSDEAKNKNATNDLPPSFTVLNLAFLISELREAFMLGLMFILPCIVIDLLVVNCFAALQVTQLSAAIVALPLKLLLFFSIDGWSLITEKLLSTYH